MPLERGKGKNVIRANVRELMHAFEGKGKIGTSTPRSKEEAKKQAVAIALSKARREKK